VVTMLMVLIGIRCVINMPVCTSVCTGFVVVFYGSDMINFHDVQAT
jgi:hypothetical protein